MAYGSILNKETDISNLLPIDGSKAMTGLLQANGGILVGKANDSPHSNIYTSSGQSLLVNSYNTLSLVNKAKDNSITRIDFFGDSTSKKISFTVANFPSLVLRPSSISAENNRITNLADGTADTDAATVGQLNAAVARGGTGVDNLDELKNILSNDIVSTRTWTANPADGLYNRDTIISNGENILSSNKILPFAFSVTFDYPSTSNWIGYENSNYYYIYDNNTGHLWGLCYYIYENSGREPNKIILSFPTSAISDTDTDGGTALHISTSWTNDDRLELRKDLLASSGNSHLCTFKFYYLNF